MTKRKIQNQLDRPNEKGSTNERGKLGRNTEYKKTGSGRTEIAEDFSVVVNPHLWKLFGNISAIYAP